MRVLNLYAGIGGNRKLWGNDHEITAIELNPNIAAVYADLYPADIVIVADAHDYLLNHYAEFDFIWSSPPCPSHSRARFGLGVHGKGYPYIYPDMSLYQEVLLLKSIFSGQWCVENVLPYYEYLVPPSVVIGRHAYWTNFYVPPRRESTNGGIAGHTCKGRGELGFHSDRLGIDLSAYTGIDRRMALRNCVEPEIGKYLLDCAVAEKERRCIAAERDKLSLFAGVEK